MKKALRVMQTLCAGCSN